MKLFDLWDAGALVAVAAVLTGIGFVYWPAALILGGSAYLWVYFRRENALAAEQDHPG